MDYNIQQAQKTFIFQKASNLCGISCLVSICKYYNIEIDELDLFNKSGVSCNGNNLLGLKEAAKFYNLIAEGYEGTIEELKDCESLCILHTVNKNGFTHFIICYGYDKITKKFLLGDPAIGIFQCDENYIKGIWQSRLLLLISAKHILTTNKSQSDNSFLKKIIINDINILIVTFLLSGISSLLSLSTAVYIQKLVDEIIPNKNYNLILCSILIYALILLSSSFFSYISERMIIKHNLLFNIRVFRLLLFKIFQLPINFFQTVKTGDILSRLSDTERIQNSIILFINSIFIEGIIFICSIVILFIYERNIGLIILLSTVLFIYVSYLYSKKIEEKQNKMMEEYAKFETYAIDILSGYETIKSNIKESIFSKRLFKIYKGTQLKRNDLKITNAKFNFYVNIVVYFISIIVIALECYYVSIDKIGIGVLFAIITILSMILQSSLKIASYIINVKEAKVAYERSLLILKHKEEEEKYEENINFSVAKESILSINNLAFKYPGHDFLLDNINLSIRTGELIAITGNIGSGKTTITKLIQRFYDPNRGNITFNNIDIRNILLKYWREQVSIASQNTKLFIGTIADNISMYSAPVEDVEKFCNHVKINHIFKKHNLDLHSLIDENGTNISGGQKQLIGIARALYRNTPIIILDEPTSAMDNATETEVINMLTHIKRTKIVLMITHKMQLAKCSDKTYILTNKNLKLLN